MTGRYNVTAMSRNISRFVVALVIALAATASFPATASVAPSRVSQAGQPVHG